MYANAHARLGFPFIVTGISLFSFNVLTYPAKVTSKPKKKREKRKERERIKLSYNSSRSAASFKRFDLCFNALTDDSDHHPATHVLLALLER